MADWTYDQIADYLETGYWQDQGKSAHKWGASTIDVDITALQTGTTELARIALQHWEDVADITFNEVTSGADITFSEPSTDGTRDAFTSSRWNTSTDEMTSATVTIDRDWVDFYGDGLNSYTYQTYVHEIGHALGLGHGGDYDGSASYPGDAVYDNDSWQASVMSYFNQNENTSIDADYARVLTPQIADMLAMQQMYGLSSSTRGGDTTYGYNATASISEVFDADAWNRDVSFTIYDTGGTDTIDMSGSFADQTINLEDEAISDVDGATGNLVIMRGVTIENAVGGSGDDTLLGNAAANELQGMAGDDTLRGDSGDDTMRFVDPADVGSSEVIDGDSGNDRVLLDSNAANATYDFRGSNFLSIEEIEFAYDGSSHDRTIQLSSEEFNSTFEFADALNIDGNLEANSDDRIELDMTTSSLDTSGWTFTDWEDNDSIEITGDGTGETITSSSAAETIDSGDGSDTITANGGDDVIDSGGGDDSVDAGPGDDIVDGGNGFDDLDGQAGTDTIDYSDFVFLGARIDLGAGQWSSGLSFRTERIANFENVLGSAGDETIIGDFEANRIEGNAGDDVIDAKGGDDVIRAGAGNDTVVWDYGTDNVDGGSGFDTVDADNASFGEDVVVDLGAGTYEVTDTGFTERWTGFERYDNADGSGSDATVLGSVAPNWIQAGDGTNTLRGRHGDDTLSGGDGGDTIDGGPGTDTASYANAPGQIRVDLSSGNGTLGEATGDTLTSIENLTGSSHDDTLIGDGGDNVLDGGDGADTLEGGLGRDTVTYAGAQRGVAVDLSTNAGRYGEAEGDSYQEIENVVGSDFADRLVGNKRNNDLVGGGDDDTLVGGRGRDVLNGQSGSDTASYLGSASAVTVELWRDYGSSGDADGDHFRSIENLRGTAFDDRLVGTGGDNTLNGRAGADHLSGGPGDDTVSFVGASGPVTADLARGVGTRGEADGDSYTAIENAIGSHHGDRLIGEAGDNTLEGRRGDDVLDGGAGKDVLSGGAGTDTASYADAGAAVTAELWRGQGSAGEANGDTYSSIENLTGSAHDDTLTGGSGDNVLDGGRGADTMSGGPGTDTVTYGDASSAVTVELYAGAGSAGEATGDSYNAIENVIGSDHDDRLVGDSGDNVLQGNGGQDDLSGGPGDDTVSYADADAGVTAKLWQGSGSGGEANGDSYRALENVTGSAHADELAGDGDDNTLQGLGGDDVLVGGPGQDTFVFAPGAGDDTVKSWDDGDDLLDLTAFGFGGFTAVDSNTTDDGGNGIDIQLSSSDTLSVLGLSKSDFDSSDVAT